MEYLAIVAQVLTALSVLWSVGLIVIGIWFVRNMLLYPQDAFLNGVAAACVCGLGVFLLAYPEYALPLWSVVLVVILVGACTRLVRIH